MYHLHVALTDLAVDDPDTVAGSLPRLPVLEGLLARADRRPADPDWRRWALALAGITAPAGDLPLARTLAARAGLEVAPGPSWLVATPVRLVPGLSSVHFDPAGPLALEAAVAAGLAERFAADFRDPSLALHAVGGQLLLQVAPALEVATRDPAQLAGRGLGDGRPTGADAGRLERLMSELQMWLHGRPLPGADGRSGNALWLWGGGGVALPPASRWPVLALDDPFLAAAARGATPVAARMVDAWRVADLLREGGSLAAADARWFAPLAARLRDGEVGSAELHAGGSLHTLAGGHRRRFWRRVRPWWEQLA
jgi:hypothetical protein